MDGPDNKESLIYRIALSLVPGVGDVLGKKIVSICGSADAVFREPARCLKKIPRLGDLLSREPGKAEFLRRAEREMAFMEKGRISALYFQDEGYPHRLKNCIDSPMLLYYRGTAGLNAHRTVALVGTRKATDYGRSVTNDLVAGLKIHGVQVISGLAYGIDGTAHKAALENGLETVGVLGHGLDTIYPWAHRPLAGKMVSEGGLITEFLSETRPDRVNFPRRNRIIAGMSDAVIVVEAGNTGGALITADIANSYNRDVFAVPGRVNDPCSLGSNELIRTNRAALARSADDIAYLMGWKEAGTKPAQAQAKIFLELSPDEELIVGLLREAGSLGIDDIAIRCRLPVSRTSAALLNLEFEGVVSCRPGRVYTLS